MSAELLVIDQLITRLNAIVESPEDVVFTAGGGQPAKPATFRPNLKNIADRREFPAVAIKGDQEILVLVSRNDAVRLTPVEARVVMGKTGRGEVFRVVTGVVRQTRKISGGYELTLRIDSTHREQITALQRLREAVERNDPSVWERWCADLKTGADLQKADLHGANLARFDFAGANLTDADLSDADLAGADFTAANLERTRLARARVGGADFFRARVSSVYANLIAASATEEIESVVYLDT